jgi:5-methyltetrahydrofolate--homocysteine methyltransferase
MLQREGIPAGECGEHLNLLDSELVTEIHRRYVRAGAQCVTTNSFGATRHKLSSYGLEDQAADINRAAVECVRAAGAQHILADIGPCGLVIEPLGPATFDEAYQNYYEQAEVLASAGPDAILIETMTDIADARCALLAARAACDLPVMVSCTFNESGRMDLSGTDPETAAAILEACGAAAVGMNCGLGPESLLPFVRRMTRATRLPVIIQPNAGIPALDASGNTVFPGTADEAAEHAVLFREAGASLIGTCCGSTPAFTAAIYAMVGGSEAVARPKKDMPADSSLVVTLASPRAVEHIGADARVRVIGERINPTGKPDLTAELEAGTMSLVCQLAAAQEEAGAHLLDVNVGAPCADEAAVLPQAISSLVGLSPCPLVLDTTDPVALEAALRRYPGRALINSVNGDPASYASVFPLAQRYGAAVLALALDETGIPAHVEGRLDIVERIRAAARAAGLTDSDLVFDMLTMTAATDLTAPDVTIRGVRALRRQGLHTVLGVSNVSHGLPERPLLNASFASLAVEAGLSAAIVNPNNTLMMEALGASVYLDDDAEFERHVERWHATLDSVLQGAEAASQASAEAVAPSAEDLQDPLTAATTALRKGILRGDTDAMPAAIDAVVSAGLPAGRVVDEVLTTTLQDLGAAFERGEAFLPQMMIAARAMKAAVAHIKSLIPTLEGAPVRGTVVFCTVKGDIHSIGKDICIALLESQGLRVVDLGVDVSAEAVVEAAHDAGADAVCLSGLMTTSLPAMAGTVEAVKNSLAGYREESGKAVLVGGAVVSKQWADAHGARYADNAPGCVKAVLELLER